MSTITQSRCYRPIACNLDQERLNSRADSVNFSKDKDSNRSKTILCEVLYYIQLDESTSPYITT